MAYASTGLCFLMQFFCQLRHARQNGALRSTKIEDPATGSEAERPRPVRKTAPRCRTRSGHIGIHHADFACSGLGNIFATTRRDPQTTALHSCCAFETPIHQPTVAAQQPVADLPSLIQAQRRVSAARSSLVSLRSGSASLRWQTG